MSNIIMVSYNGGSCGEFLCTQISKDPNFYPAELEKVTELNRWIYSNPFKKFNVDFESYVSKRVTPDQYANLGQQRPIDLKCPWIESHTYISDVTADAIDKFYNDKNLLVPTHYWGNLANINLKRVRGVRFTFNNNLDVLFYTLLWIKTWTETYPSNVEFYMHELRTCALVSGNPKMNEVVNTIIERGYMHSFERAAIRYNIQSSYDIIDKFFVDYHKMNSLRVPGWDIVNVEDLMLDTTGTVEHWKQVFGTDSTLDIETIEKYHQKNLSVIEETFNQTYDNFKKSNWKLTLKEWVKKAAPHAYTN